MFMGFRGRPDSALIRFVLVLVATSGGWIILGTALLLGGLAWGFNSHQVTYVVGGQGVYQVYASADGAFLCFQQVGTSNYYVMFITQYTPFVDPATIQSKIQAQNALYFLASTESTRLDSQVRGTNTVISYAHTIEQITFYRTSVGPAVTYTKAEYSGSPNGYVVNNWPFAGPMAGVGAIGICVALFFLLHRRRRKKLAIAANLAELESLPSPFARELGDNAGGAVPQSYRGVEQYPRASTLYRWPQE